MPGLFTKEPGDVNGMISLGSTSRAACALSPRKTRRVARQDGGVLLGVARQLVPQPLPVVLRIISAQTSSTS